MDAGRQLNDEPVRIARDVPSLAVNHHDSVARLHAKRYALAQMLQTYRDVYRAIERGPRAGRKIFVPAASTQELPA